MRNFRTVVSCLFLLLVVAGISAAENPALSSVSLNSASVVGGNSVLGAVTLNMPAPSDVEVSLAADPSNAAKVPPSDQYFIGRLDISAGPEDVLFEKQRPGFGRHFMNPFSGIFSRRFMPRGFAQMVMLDADFQKSSYYFNFVRQEFLGEVRCVVVDVQPKESAPKGLFTGRIWVEDRDFNIIRFNGTYTPHSRYSYYLHFDSWRLNLQPGVWLPTYIYIEESGTKRSSPPFHNLCFKAQTRLWGYDVERLKHDQEFTQIQVETAQDRSESARDTGPVEAQRMWVRVAEVNT